MKEIILIEIITFVSFLFSITTLFYTFAPINEMILLFLWIIAVATFYGVNKGKSIIYRMSILLLLLPLLYFEGVGAMYLIVITGILVFLYAKTSLLKGSHYDYISKFKRIFIICMIAIYFKYVFGGLSDVLNTSDKVAASLTYATPFLIMYVLTSVILTRLIRHIEFNKDIKSIRALNIKYLIGIGIVFLTTAVEQIRNSIIVGFSKVIDLMIMIIFYPMYWITRNINIEPVDPRKVEEINIETMEQAIGEFVEGDIGSIVEKQDHTNFAILRKIIGFILIAVLIYLVYRLLMKSNNRQDDNLDYTEEREYMEKTKRKKRNIFQNIIYPKDIGGQIRYYYRKYLKKLNKAEIEVVSSDTSLEINEKAKEEFGGEISGIRNIYIKSRYGDKGVDKESVEEIKKLYKKL